MMLETKGLTKNFGGLMAVGDLDLMVPPGQITGLMGPNGAGKTTVFNLITGFIKPSRGQVLFEGRDITGMAPHLIAGLGLGRTFQLAYLFPEFTVLENVAASFNLHLTSGFWESLLNTRSYRAKERRIYQEAREIVELTGLGRVRDELGKNLPHGYQKLLTLARALAIRPKLLLLDEPIGGMNPEEIARTAKVIEDIRSRGTSILMVEHNMRVMEMCQQVVVVNFGHKIAQGTLAQVRTEPEVIDAYFGQGSHA